MDSWLDKLRKLLAKRPSPRIQRYAFLVGALILGVGAYLAARSLDLSFADIRWSGVAAILVLAVPAAIVVNGWEFKVTARLLAVDLRLLTSIRTTVLATAANVLPVPGGVVVRGQALLRAGRSLRDVTLAMLCTATMWVGISAGVAAVFLGLRSSWLAVVFGAVAVALVAINQLVLRRQLGHLPDRAGLTGRLAVVEATALAVHALRLWLGLWVIGVELDLAQVLVLSVSAAIATAAGIFPGGLGLLELIGAALAPLVDLSPAAVFTGSAVGSVAWLGAHVPVALALARRTTSLDVPTDDPNL